MLDQIEESKFAALRKNCRDLGIPSPPEVFINMKVVQADGSVSLDERFRAHSWTRNFYNWMFMAAGDTGGDEGGLFGIGKMSVKGTLGDIHDNNTAPNRAMRTAGCGYFNPGVGNTFGVVVGTGNTAFSPEDFTLVSIIPDGTGTGQLSHNAMTSFGVKSYVGKVWTSTVSRYFNNNSDGAIDVAETGLIWGGSLCYSGNSEHLVERNVLSPAITMAIGAQLAVDYEISMDFSTPDA